MVKIGCSEVEINKNIMSKRTFLLGHPLRQIVNSINGVFFSPSSASHNFLSEEVIMGFQNFASKILDENKFGDPMPPERSIFLFIFRKKENCLELPEMARIFFRLHPLKGLLNPAFEHTLTLCRPPSKIIRNCLPYIECHLQMSPPTFWNCQKPTATF